MYRAFLALVAALTAASALAQEPPLKTGVDGTFAPHAMPNLSGGIQGFNVDLANEIAKRLNRKIEIEATQFSGLIPALQAGTYDFLAAPVTVTKERADNLLFTEGYLNTDFQFVVRKDAPEITRLEDFKGKVIAVNKVPGPGELADKIGWTVESFGTNTDAVQAVIGAAPMPTWRATPRSPGRRRIIRPSSCPISIPPASSGLLRCARTMWSCAVSSTSPSNA